MYDNSQYAYIVGRLRALETKMLNAGMLERLIDAPGASEVFRALNDLPLVTDSLGDYEVQDFSKVLSGALLSMKELLIQMAPYPEALKFLWHKYDFHNLKVALKAKVTGQGYEEVNHALSGLGTIGPEAWQGFVLEDKKIPLTKELDKKINFIKELYEKDANPQIINTVIDQHYLETLKAISDQLGSSMIEMYLKRLIDFSNLRAFIRVTELKKDRSVLEKLLLPGGFVKMDLYLNAFERGYEELRQALERPIGSDDLSVALEKFMEEKTLIVAEKHAFKLQQEFMARSNTISFGPEPVFSFFWRFENHMLILRAILVGKLNGLSNEVISEHMLVL
ncbi:V-type ATPase subunit [Candidatus Peregrinibacteria bacterium]|nr:V-type ATPase subunit [Candidatus Peregrinibacteria bacterium]